MSSVQAVPRKKYCESVFTPIRRKTRTVNVGVVTLGSEHPLRTQTMTTTDTKDVQGTVEQVLIELSTFSLLCKVLENTCLVHVRQFMRHYSLTALPSGREPPRWWGLQIKAVILCESRSKETEKLMRATTSRTLLCKKGTALAPPSAWSLRSDNWLIYFHFFSSLFQGDC